MSLPNEVLEMIISHLNQIDICSVSLINSRLYTLAKKKLYSFIYFTTEDPILISAKIYTQFYLNYAVINNNDSFLWQSGNANSHLVKKMVFQTSSKIFETARTIYPWVNIVAEDEHKLLSSRQNLSSTQSLFSSIPCYKMLKKLTVNIDTVTQEDIIFLESCTSLTELRIVIVKEQMLDRFSVTMLPIDHLTLEFIGELSTRSTRKLKYMFNLERLASFQLHLFSDKAYSDTFEYELTRMFANLRNVRQLSLLCQNIHFNQVLKNLKPNSITAFYLRAIPGKPINRDFYVKQFLSGQAKSLKKVFLSGKFDGTKRKYGLAEFDKLFKKDNTNVAPECLIFQIHKTRTLLQTFNQLEQVLYQGHCYFIDRISSDDTYITPCDKLVPIRLNKNPI
ncbi:uncharacterized protein SPAPADRAFT_65069 [Spathaspora passalidarum NRRL Y-27907]|uniref:F-box domain-containing protein n=1 Tax=Spathaspora passalidarum (strain NRRL Y-27907 / 11-Y1) TaxID=619300 RepID=G3AJ96_SPAPN|nr:uncharacterized protein SPAPADRAFT_65069 [Spathaspora passalidarum NRRL Y-27907]EGW33853.1 hypothetical protein SPAPADRAFT_65069 [Spathaspora passalidarum NRRL Y-27907]